jgi:hypothetical protein
MIKEAWIFNYMVDLDWVMYGIFLWEFGKIWGWTDGRGD